MYLLHLKAGDRGFMGRQYGHYKTKRLPERSILM